jgi:hypothetical protein
MSPSAKIYTPNELRHIANSSLLAEEYNVAHGCNYIVVDATQLNTAPVLPELPNCPVIALAPSPTTGTTPAALAAFDCWVPPTELEQLLAAIDAQPIAATVLCQLLRQTLTLTVSQALKNESLAYSVLQSSAGFNNWLANRAEAPLCDDQTPSVIVERQEHLLEISLNRPQRHNAYNAQMRDELCAALQIAATDQTIKQIRLLGNGPSFCSGGDLAEFGSVTDSGVAHIVRTSRSPGLLLSQLTSRVSVRLHGACIGAGIELPSFCSHVSAQPDAYFRLPEVALGLIPGAGGTVSISRRIGRQATAKLALTGATIRAQEALDLGLIDAIDHD